MNHLVIEQVHGEWPDWAFSAMDKAEKRAYDEGRIQVPFRYYLDALSVGQQQMEAGEMSCTCYLCGPSSRPDRETYRQGVIDGKTEGYDEGYQQGYKTGRGLAAMVEGDPGGFNGL